MIIVAVYKVPVLILAADTAVECCSCCFLMRERMVVKEWFGDWLGVERSAVFCRVGLFGMGCHLWCCFSIGMFVVIVDVCFSVIAILKLGRSTSVVFH